MSKEAMKLALEALSKSDDFLFDWHENESDNEADAYATARHLNEKAITALREALALVNEVDQEQPAPAPATELREQEPVAWYRDEDGIRIYYESKVWDNATPLYTSPPAQSTWVGLRDKEWLSVCWKYVVDVGIGLAIESALRSKNT